MHQSSRSLGKTKARAGAAVDVDSALADLMLQLIGQTLDGNDWVDPLSISSEKGGCIGSIQLCTYLGT
jgi:hypothetical protein